RDGKVKSVVGQDRSCPSGNKDTSWESLGQDTEVVQTTNQYLCPSWTLLYLPSDLPYGITQARERMATSRRVRVKRMDPKMMLSRLAFRSRSSSSRLSSSMRRTLAVMRSSLRSISSGEMNMVPPTRFCVAGPTGR